MAKAHHPPKPPVERSRPVRGTRKGSEDKDRPARKNGECREGCSDGNAAAFSRACGLGKLPCAEPAVLNSWTPILSAFPKVWAPPQCSLHSAQWLCQKNPGGTVSDFHVLIFLGSKKYLCPQYLTHNGTQGTAPFIWANGTGRKRNSH